MDQTRPRTSYPARPARERGPVGTALCRLRYAVRSRLSVHIWPYLALARWKYRSNESRVVTRDSELVIEGFPRSSNTFSIVAFETAQARPVKVKHHLHTAAQIIQAVRWGIPTAVLIRDPEDAVLSHMIRSPCLTARLVLRHWVRLYENILPYRDRVVMAAFGDVTTDFGSVIRRINERFGTDFTEFQHTPENVERCFAVIESGSVKQFGTLLESKVARPSAERAELKARAREELMAPALAQLRTRARAVHQALVREGTDTPAE